MTTSCGNEFVNNHMGVAPDGFKPSSAVNRYGNPSGGTGGVLPNGVDFWWDEQVSNTANCWHDNFGVDGTNASVTGPGAGAPPDVLPANCSSSAGAGDSAKSAYLVTCFLAREDAAPPESCDWYDVPPQPGTAAARRQQREFAQGSRRFAKTERAQEIEAHLRELAGLED